MELDLGAARPGSSRSSPGRRRAPSAPRSTRPRPSGRPGRRTVEARAASRTNTPTASSVTSTYTSISSTPANLAAFVIASRAASTSALTEASTGQSPALASSTRTPWSSSTSPAAADSAATSDAVSSPSGWSAYSQPRSSRSCRRASDATRRGSFAWRWMSASVCSTESWTRAATSDRSSLRMRAVRSASRSTASRQTHGPPIRSSAPATAPGASSFEDVPPPESSDDRADRGEGDAAVGQRRVRPEAAALAPGEREPGGDQRDADDRPVGEAERAEQRAPAKNASSAATQPRPSGPRPEPEVQEDPRPACQCQQREDEPDERGVDPEGLRDACADPRDHPLVSARREVRSGMRLIVRRARPRRPGADVRLEYEDAVSGPVSSLSTFRPSPPCRWSGRPRGPRPFRRGRRRPARSP